MAIGQENADGRVFLIFLDWNCENIASFIIKLQSNHKYSLEKMEKNIA